MKMEIAASNIPFVLWDYMIKYLPSRSHLTMRAFLFFYKENKLIVLVFGNIRRFSIKIVKSLENHG